MLIYLIKKSCNEASANRMEENRRASVGNRGLAASKLFSLTYRY